MRQMKLSSSTATTAPPLFFFQGAPPPRPLMHETAAAALLARFGREGDTLMPALNSLSPPSHVRRAAARARAAHVAALERVVEAERAAFATDARVREVEPLAKAMDRRARKLRTKGARIKANIADRMAVDAMHADVAALSELMQAQAGLQTATDRLEQVFRPLLEKANAGNN